MSFQFHSTKIPPFSSQAWKPRLIILALRRTPNSREGSKGEERRLSGKERDGTSLFRTLRKESGLGILRKTTSALVLNTIVRYRILMYGDEPLWVLGDRLLHL